MLLICNSTVRVPVHSGLLWNVVMDVKDIRRENLIGLISESEGKISRLARTTGQDPSTLSQIKNHHRDMGHEIARSLEIALEKPKGWMDQRQFHTTEDAVVTNELMQIKEGLTGDDLDAWLKHGRLLMKNQPKGPNNPFGDAPKPKGGTQ